MQLVFRKNLFKLFKTGDNVPGLFQYQHEQSYTKMDRTKNIPCLYFWIFGCWENKHTENTSWTIKKYPLDFLPLTCDINPCCCSCCWMVFLPWLCFWPCGVWTMCVLCVCCVYSVGVTARILISWGNWPIFIKNNGDKLFFGLLSQNLQQNFHRLPHSLQRTKVVIGSSADLVWIWL